jgi:hypothetical protein
MATVNPAEYGAQYPARFEPMAEADLTTLTVGAEAPAICDDGVRLFGLAAGEVAVHGVGNPGETGLAVQNYAGWIDL